MFRVLREKFSNQNTGLAVAFFVCFTIFVTGLPVDAGAAPQTKKTKEQQSKNARSKSAPDKKSQAKTAAAQTPKKTADKKGSAKTNQSAKSTDKKNADKKAKSADNKSKQNSSKSDRKVETKNSKQNQKNSKREPITAKNTKSEREKTKSASVREKTSEKRADSRNTRVDGVRGKTNTAKNDRTLKSSVKNSTKTAKPETNTTEKVADSKNGGINSELPQIIVTDISARVRSQAKANAPEMSRVKLGTVLKVREKNPAWYRVQFVSTGGKQADGWISANSVNDLNAGAREDIYRQIVERNYKAQMDFAAAAELVDFLTQVDAEISSSAELAFKRLLALRSALKLIPTGQADKSPYREFLKLHEKSVVYSEPAGEWYVASNLFWDVRKKHEKSVLADQIAWEAAQNPLPGECEGYVNCYLFAQRMTNGEYLRLYPAGAKSTDALASLTRFLDPIVADLQQKAVYSGPTDVTDRAEFNNLIAELRTIVSRLPLTDKEKPLQQLKQIAEAYR